MDTADRIFELLEHSGMEQKRFAQKIGATPSIVSQWRNRLSKSYKNYLPKIAEVLHTTVDYLLTGEKKEPGTQMDAGPNDPIDARLMELVAQLSPDQKKSLTEKMEFLISMRE